MISTTTAILVFLFFFHGAVASLLVGSNFLAKKDRTVKYFGLALIFNSLAFITWAFLAANRLNNLKVMASLAAVFLIVALFTFYVSAIQHLEDSTSYSAAMVVGALGALVLFVLRTFVYPSHLIVTAKGFLLFDLQTPVKAAYILAICATVLPAASAVAGKLKKSTVGPLIKICFSALAIGGIILATTTDTSLILINGAVMSAAFLVLWLTLINFGKKAPHKVA